MVSRSPPIRNQLTLGITSLIFIIIAMGGFMGARNSVADAVHATHTCEVIGRIDQIEARLRDTESIQHGYLPTSEDLACRYGGE